MKTYPNGKVEVIEILVGNSGERDYVINPDGIVIHAKPEEVRDIRSRLSQYHDASWLPGLVTYDVPPTELKSIFGDLFSSEYLK